MKTSNIIFVLAAAVIPRAMADDGGICAEGYNYCESDLLHNGMLSVLPIT